MIETVRAALTKTPPPVLYRYLDVEGAVKTLATRTNKFTPFDQLDDVREALPARFDDGSPEEEHEFLRQTLLEDPNSRSFYNSHFGTSFSESEWIHGLLTDTIDIDRMTDSGMTRIPEHTLLGFQKDLSSDCAICSFSEYPDIELMWAGYAQKHHGFCLAFHIPRQLALQKVEYTDEPVSLPFVVGHQDIETYRKASRILRTKRMAWEYQKEWRIILRQTNLRRVSGVLLAPFAPQTLKGIILGARNSSDEDSFARFFRRQFPDATISKAFIPPSDSIIEINELSTSVSNWKTDNISPWNRIQKQLADLDSVFRLLGIDDDRANELFAQSAKSLKREMAEKSSEAGMRLLSGIRRHDCEHTLKCAAALILAYSFRGALFFSSDHKMVKEYSRLFFAQKQNEVISALPPDFVSIDDCETGPQFLSRVFELTRYD